MYACTFCDRTFDDKDERTKHRIEIHPHMRGTKGQCCVCARPFPGLFPFMDHMDEVHPVETAQIVVAPENQLRAYGWQYQEAFFEEGKDHRFNNMDYIIHINKLKRRQEEKELEESDDDDDECSYDGEEEEQKEEEEVPQAPSPAPTEGYLDDGEMEKDEEQDTSTGEPIDVKPIILKFGVAEDANRKRSQIEETPEAPKRHRGLTERDSNIPDSSNSSIIQPQLPTIQPQQQQVQQHQHQSSIPTQTTPLNQYKISPLPPNQIKTSPLFPANQYINPTPPLPPSIPLFNPNIQQRMPYPSGLLAPNFPQYPMMHQQLHPHMPYPIQQMQPMQPMQSFMQQQMQSQFGQQMHPYQPLQQLQAQFGMNNSTFTPQMSNMWQMPPTMNQPLLLPNTAMSSTSSSYVPMTPSPTSSNVTSQSRDETKKEEIRSTSRISTPSEMKSTEDLKEPQQGNIIGHIQFPLGTTQDQMNAIPNYSKSVTQNGPSTSTAVPPLQQQLNVQIDENTGVQEENMPQLTPEIDPVGLSPAETKPVVFLPKTPSISTDIISVKPLPPNFTTVSSIPPSLPPESPLDKGVEATILAAASAIESEMEEGEVEDGTPLIQQAISAMLYGGGTRNSTIGIPTFLPANEPACQADSNYWTGKSGNSCPRCGAYVDSRAKRKSHYEKCHYALFYYYSRSRLSDIEKWLSIKLGKESNERRDSRNCVHCPRREFQGRTELLLHLESDHKNTFHEYGRDYVRAFVEKHVQTSNIDLHNHLVRAADIPSQ